jgi:hypothetical protein
VDKNETYDEDKKTGLVQFRFPAEEFDDKDWTTVELTFDLITWALADEQRVAVVTDVEITQIRPSHSYVGKVD